MKLPKHLAELVCEIDPTARGFLQPDGSMHVEIVKALYGFPESAKLWYEYMSQVLINAGYKKCTMEPCLFKKVLDNNKWSYVTIYVDDCLHTYKGANMRVALYNCLLFNRLKTDEASPQQANLFIYSYETNVLICYKN